MRFYIVDAFAESVFGGNPAGIVMIDAGSDFPSEDIMLKTAAELRYSETAFIKTLLDGTLHMRYFTPTAEVEFCGHATVGAFAALIRLGSVKKYTSHPIVTLSGKLTIEIDGDFIMMKMPTAKEIKQSFTADEVCEIYNALGIKYKPVATTLPSGSTIELLPQLLSVGFPDIFVPVKSRHELASICPDFKVASALSEKYGAGGIHAFTLESPGDEIMACARNFAPLFGIDEEAATGTASGGLIYYLYKHGITFNQPNCYFLQGEAMGRPSKVYTSLNVIPENTPTQNLNLEIKVGGKGAVLAEGQIHLPD